MDKSTDSTINSSLTDQAKKMEIALHYTGGDAEKARLMVSGQYNDIYALKCKFSSSTIYGAFILFFHQGWLKLLNTFAIVTPSYAIDTIDLSTEWQVFEKKISDEIRNTEHDYFLGRTLKKELEKQLDYRYLKQIVDLLKADNRIEVSRIIQNLVQGILALTRIDLDIVYQAISSLDMELHSITSSKIGMESKNKDTDSNKDKEMPIVPLDEEPEKGKSGIKLILNSNLVLSPIKGKNIAELAEGDRVKINITDRNPKAITIAKALNSYDEEEGTLKPLFVRVKSIQHYPGEGYKIYAIIAKGILAKIIEEEENIKIAVEGYSPDIEETEQNQLNHPLVIILSALIAILVIIIVAYLLLGQPKI